MLKRTLATLAIITAAASVAGLGTFATFTSSTSASHTVSAGSVSVALGAVGPANRLTLGATGILPGDTLQRAVDLTNNGVAGSDNLSSITLTTSAAPSTLLDTDATNGLQMVIDKCAVAWTESASPPYTYTCGGATTSVLASRAVIGSNIALSGLASTTTGSTDRLRVTLTLPGAAPNTMQGLSSTLTYTFVGSQRAAASK
jgi:predicted ribosomally synthesized peptide with SipW-like signal peptide